MGKSRTSFKENNKAAEKWTFEKAEEFIINLIDYARKNDVYTLSEVCYENDQYPFVLDYIVDKFKKDHPVFESYKKALQDALIDKVNRGALKQELSVPASIWRMKQLGEKDTQYQNTDITSKGDKIQDNRDTQEILNDVKRLTSIIEATKGTKE